MPSAQPPPEGTLLAGRYRLETVLGDGGMGRVWQGYDETLGRRVAVKEVLYPRDLSDRDQESLSERTMREARLTAQLNHPNVVTTYDAVVDEGRPFIVMELVPSVSLADHIAAHGPMPPDEVARLGVTLLDTLAMAHSRGIVHRDVKPSNVLLADDGRVLLSDFGIATHESDPTLTTSGILVGSPAFMSPERLRGERRGYAADVWALGATLYTALEGHPPFRADTSMGTITAIMSDDVVPPRTSGPLADAVMGMLEKDHERRSTLEDARPLLVAAAEGGTTVAGADVGTAEQEAVPPAWEEHAASALPPEQSTEEGRDGAGPRMGPPPSPPLPEESEPRRRRGVVLPAALAVLVALAVVGLGAAVVSSLGDGGDTQRAQGSGGEPAAGPSGTAGDGDAGQAGDGSAGERAGGGGDGQDSRPPTPEEVPQRAAPRGFAMHQDPLGFRVAVPEGWERRRDSETRVDFVSPDGRRFVRVDQRADALPDAAEAWRDAEPGVADRLEGYQRIRIEPVPHPRWDVADWEFTWESGSGTLHVLNRGIATDTRGFALYVSSPHRTWESEGRPVFDVVSNTFAPTR